MPGMSGEDLVSEVRRDPKFAAVPIIMMTGSSEVALRLRLLEGGVQDFLLKPLLPAELRLRAMHLVQAKNMRQSLQRLVNSQEDELGVLTREVEHHQHALERAVEEAQRAQRLAQEARTSHENFMRIIAHELRTPLASQELHLSLWEDTIVPEQAGHMGAMRRGHRRLVRLVDTLVYYQRISAQSFHPTLEEVDLVELCREAVEEFTDSQRSCIPIRVDGRVENGAVARLQTDAKVFRLGLLNLFDELTRYPNATDLTLSLREGVRLVLGGHVASRQGFAVRTARDGAQVLAALAETPVDLLILDMMMPGKSGYEVLDEAQNLPAVLLLTADTRAHVLQALYPRVRILEKPVTVAALLKAVQDHNDA